MTQTPPLATPPSLAQKAAHGVFWNYFSFSLGKGLVFITTALLARLLTPEQFGLVGFATIAVNYLSVVKDLGLGAALIQRREEVDGAADTVFTLNLLLGVGLTLLATAVAPLTALYFREPLVTPILRWMGLTFALNALGAIHIVRLQRQLDFKRKLVPDIGRSLVKGIVSIGLAVAGFGVWSLVWGQLAGVVTGVVLAWIMFPWRPRWVIDRLLAGTMLRYGLPVIGTDALTITNDTLDYLIVGRLLGSVALGIYIQAYRLPELLVLSLLWVLSAVIFPTYSVVRSEPQKLEQAFWATMRFTQIIVLPICLGLIIAADPLVRVAFGPQWLEAIPIVRVLALFALVRSVGYHIGDIYKAMGRPDILVKLGLISLVLLLPTLLVGVYYGGLIGVAVAHLLAACVRTVVRWAVAGRFITIRPQAIWAAIKPALLGSVALALLAVPTLAATAVLPPPARLLLTALAGGVGYVTTLWLLERESLLQVGRLVGIRGVG